MIIWLKINDKILNSNYLLLITNRWIDKFTNNTSRLIYTQRSFN